MSEWSVSSALDLAKAHDNRVIVEGDSADEETILGKSAIGDQLDLDEDDDNKNGLIPSFGGT